MKKIIRLGTRGSPLALIQAQIVRDELYSAFDQRRQDFEIEIVPIRTSGDWVPSQGEKSFLELSGSKGLFTKEIEEALLTDTIDCAVHSMKDVSVHVPDGLIFASFLKRDDPRDAFMCATAPTVMELPAGARVGTSSLRRRAQVLALRPDLTIVPLRGNVDTRMKKLASGEADATILAVAGLNRLGVIQRAASIFDTQTMLPSAAQGILGLQTREDDVDLRSIVSAINHQDTELCCLAERSVLRVLDGSCRTPIAAYAVIDGAGEMVLEALVAKTDGSQIIRRSCHGLKGTASQIGDELGAMMKKEVPTDFYSSS